MTRYQPVFFDIETTGLNPMAQHWWDSVQHGARVICVGIGTLTDWRGNLEDSEPHVTVFSDEQEYVLLENLQEWTYDFLDEYHPDIDNEFFFVGWNSRTFDHPYIGARYSRLRLNGYPFTHGWKRLDLFRVIRKKTGKYWKQDDYIEELSGERAEDDVTGAEIPELFEKNRLDKIRKHCNADVYDLIDIFRYDRTSAMRELYDHYDIDKEVVFVEEV